MAKRKTVYGRVIKNYGKKGGYNIMIQEKGSYWAKWGWRKTKADAQKEMRRVKKQMSY